ncbi:DivIVA domain-containing protein [Lentzea tibetensis]|uniref:Cell wall synthesis protein Wag31 n=1 Tax=Lentzea tibetensis TaxID=2591470 RepID=A0A563EHC1_9PSEU|nr:DivIVA domain-containing protein [Lentzea tibetensis]TWP45945.1 DivIVA domain-containing protein [Lentzea tibetensis]
MNRKRALRAHDVQTVTFGRSRFGQRGYSENEVDAFLDVVADSLTELHTQLSAARAEVQRVKNWRQEHGIPEQGVRAPTSAEVHLHSRAQQEAEQLVGRAHRLAAQIERQAHDQYDQVLLSAHQQAEAAARAVTPDGEERAYWRAFVHVMRVNLTSVCAGFLEELERFEGSEFGTGEHAVVTDGRGATGGSR